MGSEAQVVEDLTNRFQQVGRAQVESATENEDSDDEEVAVPLSAAQLAEKHEDNRLYAEQFVNTIYEDIEGAQEQRAVVATSVRNQLKELPQAQEEEDFNNQGIPYSKVVGRFGKTMYAAVLPSRIRVPRNEDELFSFMKSAQAALAWNKGSMGLWGRDQRHGTYAEDGRKGLLRARTDDGPDMYGRLLAMADQVRINRESKGYKPLPEGEREDNPNRKPVYLRPWQYKENHEANIHWPLNIIPIPAESEHVPPGTVVIVDIVTLGELTGLAQRQRYGDIASKLHSRIGWHLINNGASKADIDRDMIILQYAGTRESWMQYG